MARPIEFDITAARESAMKLFWRNGYQASSLSSLLDEMDIGRGSFYATFGDKRRLYLECLDMFADRTVTIIQKCRASHPPLEALRCFLQHSLTHAGGSSARHGCMLVNTVIELASVDPGISDVANAWLMRLQDLLAECLREAGFSPPRAAEFAAYLTLVNEGIRVSNRRNLPRRQSLDAIDTALRLLETAPR
jgi:TetR/AcrR family transcriptional repressor of nem operon